MALTCKWVTEETGALVMKWTRVDDEVPIIVPEMPRLEQSTKASATNDGLVTEVPNGAAKIWRVSASAYYLGRPAALWLAALAPRRATHKSPAALCKTDSVVQAWRLHDQSVRVSSRKSHQNPARGPTATASSALRRPG